MPAALRRLLLLLCSVIFVWGATPSRTRADSPTTRPPQSASPRRSSEERAEKLSARARRLYQRGKDAAAQGRVQEALDAYEEAYRLCPRALFLLLIGNAASDLGQLERAILALRGYLEYAPPRLANREQTSARLYALYESLVAAEKQKLSERPSEAVRRAEYALAERARLDFSDFAVKTTHRPTLVAYVDAIKQELNAGYARAQQIAQMYTEVPGPREHLWQILGLIRQAQVSETVARAIWNLPLTTPDDLRKQMQKLPADAKNSVNDQVEDSMLEAVAATLRPIECHVIVNYARAIRFAREAKLRVTELFIATDHLGRYGDAYIAKCLDEQNTREAAFLPYRPGEFAAD
ncbi:MAG: domain protein putative component of TonB system [Myxococcaceae bacterium]|nr:domain protein putative component of TonB system [Myxococcaceae bacterium]